MKNRNSRGRVLRYVLYAILCGIATLGSTLRPVIAQENPYFYIDKLYGETHVFTPKGDEVMVRFAPSAGKQEAPQDLARQMGAEVVHEANARHRFAVLRTGAGKAGAETLAETLDAFAALPSVEAVLPAMVDREGATVYFLPDELTVQFRKELPEARMQAVLDALGLEVAEAYRVRGYYALRLPQGRDLFDAIRQVMQHDDVLFAEPAFLEFDVLDFDPDDTNYPQQWSLHNDGTNATGATADADIDAREAWDIERGDPRVLVIVIDSGVDWDHPDLRGNVAHNLGEDADGDGQTFTCTPAGCTFDPGDLNGIDDDGNGEVDDLTGWDYSNDDNDPHPSPAGLDGVAGMPHGTACAGIVAAMADNNLGVAGLAHGARVMGISRDETVASSIEAIDYGATFANNAAAGFEGVILSNSWGGGHSAARQLAVQNARAAGVLPVFAAGNNNAAVGFPARYPEALAVAATSPCDTRKRSSSNAAQVNPGVSTDPLGTSCDGEAWWGSNFGAELSIGAPGVLMPTTDISGTISGTNGYAAGDYVNNFNGTSSATPVVAAAAALVMSHHLQLDPGAPMLTPDEVQDILETSADEVGGYAYVGGFSNDLGAGRVNMLRALQELIARHIGTITAPPVDIALSIDRSGSMGPPLAPAEKFNAAKNAAAQVVRDLNIGDRIAVTSYATTAGTDFGMTTINAESDKDAAIDEIEDLLHGGATTVGGGLLEARGELVSAFPPQEQSIILLTDGQSNTAPFVQPVLDAGILATTYTIGFGTPGFDIDEDTLSQIASQTGGAYFFAGSEGIGPSSAAKTLASAGGLTLIKGYQASFHKAARRQMLKLVAHDLVGAAHTELVGVDQAVDEMRFGLLWDLRQAGMFELVLESPSGLVIDVAEAAANPLVDFVGDRTLASYRVRKPEPGTWQMHLVSTKGQVDARVHFSAAAYTDCRLVLSLTPQGLGRPLLIQAWLLLGGKLFVPPQAVVTADLHLPGGSVASLVLNDQGENGDQEAGDGVFSLEVLDLLKEGGTYTVEALLKGVDPDGFPIERFDVASTFLGERKPVPIGLPHLVYLPGTGFKLPILVHKWVHPLDIVSGFEALIGFDPQLLKMTGEVDSKGTLTEGWDCHAEEQTPGNVLLKCSAPEGETLEGDGTLTNLLFQVDPGAQLGDESRLVFLEFRHDGELDVETRHGTLKVGKTFVGEQLVLRLPKEKGWSLTSLPVGVPDGTSLRQLFPGMTSAFGYDPKQGYVEQTTAGVGDGFWLKLGDDVEAEIGGDPLASYSKMLEPGWHLIGSLYEKAFVSTDPPAAMEALFIYDPQGGYDEAQDTIDVGQGAWVRVSSAAVLTVRTDDDDDDDDKAQATKQEERNGQPVSALLRATGAFLEGYVHSSSVVLGVDAEQARQVPLPPPMPAYTVQLNLRRTAGRTAPLYRDIRQAADLATAAWILDVDPNGSTFEERTAVVYWDPAALRAIADVPWTLREGEDGTGPVLVADMREVTSVSVTGTTTRTFTIAPAATTVGVEAADLPATFALEANYPNPFNPSTQIRYATPEAAHVRLEIFNVLGQRVQVLVDGVVEAGRHTITWDGRGANGEVLPSGIYLYRMETGRFTETRRMVFLK